MRYFAHALPGLGPLLRAEIAEVTEVSSDEVGSDGRNDVVTFEARGGPPRLRIAEDVFVEVGRGEGRAQEEIAATLLTAESLERALSAYAGVLRPLRRRMTVRVVTRVRSEQDFHRSALREALRRRVGELRPHWVDGDPADIELWAAQVGRTWLAGIRLTAGPRSRRTTRRSERAGALRPSVAAAMAHLAGPVRGRLLDPCCGSGTILIEAAGRGWAAVGADVDPAAVHISAANSRAALAVADARDLPFPTGSFEAAASNLPFGVRFAVPERPGEILGELARVTAHGGRVVLLMPPALETAIQTPDDLEVVGTTGIRLLGRATTLWTLTRR